MAEHDVEVDPNIHEPKGISIADSGDLCIANGAGSCDWGPWPASTRIISDLKVDWTNMDGIAQTKVVSERLVAGSTVFTQATRFLVYCPSNANSLEFTGEFTRISGTGTATARFKTDTNNGASITCSTTAGVLTTGGLLDISDKSDAWIEIIADINADDAGGSAEMRQVYVRIL